MSLKKIAIHVLTAFPPSNPNRDETGQPKTAVVGGKTRQRISSQCIKRAWRLSEPFQLLEAQFSTRTRGLGGEVMAKMKAAGMGDKEAKERASKIAEQFGKVDKKRAPDHAEMVVLGHEEWSAALELANKLATDGRDPTAEELAALPRETVSLDCALFGRMRAANPSLNVDGAVAVSHPLTTNQGTIEADFWTSVDDLKQREDSVDQGSGGMGDVEFGSGIYYTYAEVSLPALLKNLRDDKGLANKAIVALIKAISTTVPGGHLSSFGNSVRAGYLRVECGDTSGNLFCPAYEVPVTGLLPSIKALRAAADREAAAYGLERTVYEVSVPEGVGTLPEVLSSIAAELERA